MNATKRCSWIRIKIVSIVFDSSFQKHCQDKKKGPKRWLKTRGNDPGRIPQHLADNPLNQAERIVISKYVIFGNMNKMNISCGNKLYGHVIAIPLDKDIRQRAVAGTSLYHLHVIFSKRNEYHCSKDNAMNMCNEEKMTHKRITEILRDYQGVMGPNVGTCSCVKCGVFCTELEGKYRNTAELDQFHMTQDEYDALSMLKRRFLHIVKVPASRIPEPNAYYHICERGLRNKIDGKWKWWHQVGDDERINCVIAKCVSSCMNIQLASILIRYISFLMQYISTSILHTQKLFQISSIKWRVYGFAIK